MPAPSPALPSPQTPPDSSASLPSVVNPPQQWGEQRDAALSSVRWSLCCGSRAGRAQGTPGGQCTPSPLEQNASRGSRGSPLPAQHRGAPGHEPAPLARALPTPSQGEQTSHERQQCSGSGGFMAGGEPGHRTAAFGTLPCPRELWGDAPLPFPRLPRLPGSSQGLPALPTHLPAALRSPELLSSGEEAQILLHTG